MKNLKKLFLIKPDIGWGDSQEYNGTAQDVFDAVNLISGHAVQSIIFERAAYREECKEQNREPISYKEWRLKYKKEKSFRGHMFNNYTLKDGDFILDISIKELDDLAGVLLSFT